MRNIISKKFGRQKGFTLIELMVVIAIVAIMASIALPSFQNMMYDYRMKKAATSLSTVFLQARAQALKVGSVPVDFDGGYNHWRARYSDKTSAGRAQTIHDVQLSASIDVTTTDSPTSPIVFYKTGRANFNSQYTFKVCASGATGRVAYEVILYGSGATKVQRNGTC